MADSVPRYNYDTYFNPTKDLNVVASSNGTVTDDGMMIVQKTPNKYHTVRKGETLGKIASKYHTSVGNIKSWNHLRSTNLRVGQKLIVKKGTTVKVPNPNAKQSAQDSTKMIAENGTTDSVSTKCDTIGTPVTAKPQPEIKPVQPQASYTSYTIRQGDTLSSIARRYNTTADYLADYNKLANKNAIQVGQKLKIPTK